MKLRYFLIIICIMVLAVSGCTHNDSNQPINSSYTKNNTTNPTSVPTTTNTGSNSGNIEVSGKCTKVVDGDTIDVEGVGRVRFVGVNTPERGQSGYQTAKDYVSSMCLGKTVGLDIDNAKNKDKYDRTLAVVYVGGVNLEPGAIEEGLC